MKKIILSLVCFCCWHLLHAQASMTISSGAHFVVNGASNVVMDTGSFVNNGTYIDSTGMFKASGGIDFSGSGTTRMNNFMVNNSQTTNVNSIVSVYNTATLTAGNLNANNNLYIRSDNNTTANMVVTGVLNNTVRGIIARASSSTSSGCAPYTSNLTLNISGPAMVYQWQSSGDSATWGNITGATAATYTASVTATTYYRCNLSTNNSGYSQSTPGVKLTLLGALPPITGTATVCANATTLLSNAASGGTWSSGNTSVATINTSGLVTGITAGTSVIMYTAGSGCTATRTVTVNPSPTAITGTTSICVGATTVLSCATGGGVSWTSSNSSVATIGSMSGVLTGISPGTAAITYTVASGCFVKIFVSVNTVPAPITGTLSLCSGNSGTVSSSTSGGTWLSANTAVATITGTGGIAAIAAGTANITYTLPSGCLTYAVVTVGLTPAAISGPLSMCVGGNTALSCATTGGTWSSSNSAVGTVNTTGLVAGISLGTAAISYTHSTGCSRSVIVSVNAAPSSNTGTPTVCVGSTTTLSNATSGGAWSSSTPSKASVNTTGVVTGVSPGVVSISYSLGSGCIALTQVTVNASLANITGAANICVGTTTTFTHPTSGGIWTSSNSTLATVGSSTGLVTGVGAGIPSITYTVGSCFKVKSITVSGGGAAITGVINICQGSTSVLSCSTPGGISWTSSNTAVATIGSTSGVVTGVSAGTSNITYLASSGCTSTATVTIQALPTAISGTLTVCQGATTTLASVGSTGGTWTSTAPSKATIGSSTGLVTGVSGGTSAITYTWTNGCKRGAAVTVSPLPAAAAIVGAGTMSPTTAPTQTLTASIPGGTWTSANPARATIVAGTGFMTAISAGVVTISYTRSNSCGSRTDSRVFTILSPKPGIRLSDNNINTIRLYPNPTTGAFTLEAPCGGTLSLYTIDGRLVAEFHLTESTTLLTLSNELSAGIYMCRFNGDDGTTAMVRLVYEP